MTTVTSNATIKSLLDEADPNKIADLFRAIKLGTMLDPIEETITIAAGTVIDLTADSVAGLAAQQVLSVRVVTGTATGARIVSDAAETPTTTSVAVAADGTTITFEANITVALVRWLPVPENALSTDFPTTGLG